MRASLIAATLLFTCAAAASAQSLADVARKEGQRRQGAPAAPKTYTNQDLKPVRTTEAATPADGSTPDNAATDAAKSAPPGAVAVKEAGPAAERPGEVKDQAYWTKRIAALREQLGRDETYLEAMQTRVNALTMDFVNRDDPVQRGQIERDRSRALVELERLKNAVELDRAALSAFEEEARRAGVPPGWLR